jgi:hypothetical protein
MYDGLNFTQDATLFNLTLWLPMTYSIFVLFAVSVLFYFFSWIVLILHHSFAYQTTEGHRLNQIGERVMADSGNGTIGMIAGTTSGITGITVMVWTAFLQMRCFNDNDLGTVLYRNHMPVRAPSTPSP